MDDNELHGRLKLIFKLIPGVKWLNVIRLQISRIRELSNLVKEGKIVIFHPYSIIENDKALIREMVFELIKERIDLYGTCRLGKVMATTVGYPAGAFLLFSPLAIMRIPFTHDDYLMEVESEIRRKIRVAGMRGYKFKEFLWNDHLEEIFKINTSKQIRQGELMRGWYQEPVQPRYHSKEELQYKKYYGAFLDGELCAYLHIYLFGDVAISKHFIGHAQHLRYGVMNGLISFAIQEFTKNFQIQWFYYGDWQKKSPLTSFKREAGFQAYTLLLDFKDDHNMINYSTQKKRCFWHI